MKEGNKEHSLQPDKLADDWSSEQWLELGWRSFIKDLKNSHNGQRTKQEDMLVSTASVFTQKESTKSYNSNELTVD